MAPEYDPYVILEEPSPADLAKAVRAHLAEGWRTCGGPFTYSYAAGHGPVAATTPGHPQTDGWLGLMFCQAMERD